MFISLEIYLVGGNVGNHEIAASYQFERTYAMRLGFSIQNLKLKTCRVIDAGYLMTG